MIIVLPYFLPNPNPPLSYEGFFSFKKCLEWGLFNYPK